MGNCANPPSLREPRGPNGKPWRFWLRGTSASTPCKPRQATSTRSARSRRHETEYLVLEERYIDALDAGDVARIETSARLIDSVTERRDAILIGYGFKVCGQN
jgi:hypothetical protein